MNEIATPTVGRIVLVHLIDELEPVPAMVQAVEEGALRIKCVHVFLHDGIRILRDLPHETQAKNGDGYWDWMAYQKGQAAKTEALQAELNKQVSAARDGGKNVREMDRRAESGKSYAGAGSRDLSGSEGEEKA